MTERRLRVAMIGLGDIARKAYLPVLASDPSLELHLVTRSAQSLAELGEAYRLPGRHEELASALAAGLDAAFVHAATPAHPEIVEALLRAGIPTYVDKPLATDAATCEHLVHLSEQSGCSLMVGFNRRFAPAYVALAARPRDIILMQKNRARLPGTPRDVIFDDFIHVVDTLLWLFPGEVLRSSFEVRLEQGALHHIALHISGAGATAIGIMNRMSGADEESLEVGGRGEKRRVTDLAETTVFGAAYERIRRPDWKPATWVRGIDQACAHFLDAVRSGSYLSPRGALATHHLCEAIAVHAER